MVTNADAPEQSPGNRERITDAAYVGRDTVARGIRTVVAGDASGRVRRGVLYVTAGLGLVIGEPVAYVGIAALILLAWTDAVVEA